jgi:hypothetical protein
MKVEMLDEGSWKVIEKEEKWEKRFKWIRV